jgi:hypothetical protein
MIRAASIASKANSRRGNFRGAILVLEFKALYLLSFAQVAAKLGSELLVHWN